MRQIRVVELVVTCSGVRVPVGSSKTPQDRSVNKLRRTDGPTNEYQYIDSEETPLALRELGRLVGPFV